MINARNKELMENQENNTKKTLNAKAVSETYCDGSYGRFPNFIKLLTNSISF